MKKEKQNGTLQKLLPILLLLAGVTVFGTGLSGLARMAGYRRATGVVTEVAAGEVYVAFPAEAGEQSASLGAISRGCAVGTRLPLLYRPDHPADAVPSDRTVNGVLTGVGAALLIGGKAGSLADGIRLAAELIDSGKAAKTLEKLIEVSNA